MKEGGKGMRINGKREKERMKVNQERKEKRGKKQCCETQRRQS